MTCRPEEKSNASGVNSKENILQPVHIKFEHSRPPARVQLDNSVRMVSSKPDLCLALLVAVPASMTIIPEKGAAQMAQYKAGFRDSALS